MQREEDSDDKKKLTEMQEKSLNKIKYKETCRPPHSPKRFLRMAAIILSVSFCRILLEQGRITSREAGNQAGIIWNGPPPNPFRHTLAIIMLWAEPPPNPFRHALATIMLWAGPPTNPINSFPSSQFLSYFLQNLISSRYSPKDFLI